MSKPTVETLMATADLLERLGSGPRRAVLILDAEVHQALAAQLDREMFHKAVGVMSTWGTPPLLRVGNLEIIAKGVPQG